MKALPATQHPLDDAVRSGRLPHIWCPGCGLGPVLRAYISAMEDSGTPADEHAIVSGIGCTGRSAGYAHIDSYHTTHGRPIPFATGLKVANPKMEVTVFSGDGDLTTIGGNHLIHAARRNVDLNVICVNNFNYGMTGGQFGATTPHEGRTTTTPFGNSEYPFNLPLLVAAAGAPFVSRWTSLHIRQVKHAIAEAFETDGFSFIEVISPCPVGFAKKNGYKDALDMVHQFQDNAVVDHDADLMDVGITMAREDPIVVGDFVRKNRPSYLTAQRTLLERVLGGVK